MNILPKKRNFMNVKLEEAVPEPPEEPIKLVRQDAEEDIDSMDDEAVEDQKQVEEVFSTPNNEALFKETPKNIIEPDEQVKPKKKRKLSEKQLAHLARMRTKAIAARKARKEAKELEKQKKRDAKEAKRKAKEEEKERKRLEREANKPTPVPKANVKVPSNPDLDFERQQNRQASSSIPSRQTQQNTRTTSNQRQNNTPRNPYLGNLIPY